MTPTNGTSRGHSEKPPTSPAIRSLAARNGSHKPRAVRVAAAAAAPTPVPVPVPAAAVRPALAAKSGRAVKVEAGPTSDHARQFAETFGALGTLVAGMVPKRGSAKQRAAAEYWGASLASQAAEGWRGKAKVKAVAEGVLPDYETNPSPIGTAETVYTDGLVAVGMKVVAQADRHDVPGLVADLTKAGVDPKVLKRLLKKHTRSFNGAHIFTATLV